MDGALNIGEASPRVRLLLYEENGYGNISKKFYFFRNGTHKFINHTSDELIKKADRAMYKVKEQSKS